jgi:hypothetical protein
MSAGDSGQRLHLRTVPVALRARSSGVGSARLSSSQPAAHSPHCLSPMPSAHPAAPKQFSGSPKQGSALGEPSHQEPGAQPTQRAPSSLRVMLPCAAGQGWHTAGVVAPSAAEKRRLLTSVQRRHTESAVARVAVEKVPARQVSHAESPAEAAKRPAAQSSQRNERAAGAEVPTPHKSHAALASAPEKDPGAH